MKEEVKIAAAAEQRRVKHQAEAWCHVVTMLICEFGLGPNEPGDIALDQVQNFLRRSLSAPSLAQEKPYFDAAGVQHIKLANGETLLSRKFWRFAAKDEDIPKKQNRLIEDVAWWLETQARPNKL